MNVGKGNSCEEFFIGEIKELQEEHDSAPSSQLHKLFVLQTPLQSQDVHSSIVVVVVAAEEFEDGEDSSSSTTALVLLLEATLVASATLQSTRTGMTPVGQTVQGAPPWFRPISIVGPRDQCFADAVAGGPQVDDGCRMNVACGIEYNTHHFFSCSVGI